MAGYLYPDSNDQVVWKLDESAAPFVNTGVLGSGANLSGSGSYTPAQAGKWGNCVQFGGAGFLYTADGVAEINFPITISAWVYPTSWSPNYGGFLCRCYYVGGTDSYPYYAFTVNLGTEGNGSWYTDFHLAGDNNVLQYFSAADKRLQSSVWQHIGVAYDGVLSRVYKNGVLIGSKAITGGSGNIDYTNHADWRVGRNQRWYTSGSIDDVRIANVARNEAWFKQAYEGVLQREAIVIKSGIPTIIGTDTLRADRGAHAGLTTTGLASGDAVQVSGALTLQKAVNTSTSPIIGVYDGVTGSVVREGVVVATFSGSCPAAGSAVYLSATAGQLTGTKPTNDMLHEVGVVVDASTSRVLLQQKPVIALPVTPPPYVWFPNESSGGLTQLLVSDGSYINRVQTGVQYVHALYDGTYVWAISQNSGANTIIKVNPATGALVGGWSKDTLSDAAGRNIAFDGTNYWYVVNGSSNNLRCINSSGESVGTYTIANLLSDIIYDGVGNIWVRSNGGYYLRKIRVSDGAVQASVDLNYLEGRAIFTDKTNIWVPITRSGDGSTPADLKKIRISDAAVTTYSGFTGSSAFGGFYDGTNVWFFTIKPSTTDIYLYKVRPSDGATLGSWLLTGWGAPHCIRYDGAAMWSLGMGYGGRVRKWTLTDPPVSTDYPVTADQVANPRDCAFTNIVLPWP